jgi:hypothetical protein
MSRRAASEAPPQTAKNNDTTLRWRQRFFALPVVGRTSSMAVEKPASFATAQAAEDV